MKKWISRPSSSRFQQSNPDLLDQRVIIPQLWKTDVLLQTETLLKEERSGDSAWSLQASLQPRTATAETKRPAPILSVEITHGLCQCWREATADSGGLDQSVSDTACAHKNSRRPMNFMPINCPFKNTESSWFHPVYNLLLKPCLSLLLKPMLQLDLQLWAKS